MIMDVPCTLRSMRIPLEESAWMLGNNSSAITSFSQLGKCHCALVYHRVRSVVAHKAIKFCFVKSTENVGDPLTKILPRVTLWRFIQPLLFRELHILLVKIRWRQKMGSDKPESLATQIIQRGEWCAGIVIC